MKKLLFLIPLAALLSSCASNPLVSTTFVQTTVAGGVSLALIKATNSAPYVAAARDSICATASSTDVSPAKVVADLEASPAAKIKTPEAVVGINFALSIYNAAWSALGTNTAKAQPYLQAVCNGISDALPPPGPAGAKRAKLVPPHVR